MGSKVPAIAEKELQKQLEKALTDLGFLWFHDRSLQHATVRTSKPGFPDICAVHPESGLLVFIELKSQRGKMSPAQILWKEALEKSCALYFGPVKPDSFDDLIRRLYLLVTIKK
jgi:hypothetical protein